MKRLTLICFLLISSNLNAQLMDSTKAKRFINTLVNNSNQIQLFVDEEELQLSKRLGISYEENPNKFLISQDIPLRGQGHLKSEPLDFSYSIENLDRFHSKLTISTSEINSNYEFYFKNSKLISKPKYFGKDWEIIESKYFRFHVSNINDYNSNAATQLEKSVERILSLLKFSKDEIKKLQRKKIIYYLCKDEKEIQKLTGYKARGLYYIPYDYIISTFNAHLHEVLHLLINYKIKENKLYTQPFLQEGFAVAYGGRGGKSPDVILNMGKFIIENDFLSMKNLLSRKEFYSHDASMTYPIAGLYTKFLIEQFGIQKFLELYNKYSGNLIEIEKIGIDTSDFPTGIEWNNFVNYFSAESNIRVSDIDESDFPVRVIDEEYVQIYSNKNSFLFKIKNDISFTPKNIEPNYISKLFSEFYPNREYNGEQYIIKADQNEISIYDLYTNTLTAKYVSSFSKGNKLVTLKKGFLIFMIHKNLIDLNNNIIDII